MTTGPLVIHAGDKREEENNLQIYPQDISHVQFHISRLRAPQGALSFLATYVASGKVTVKVVPLPCSLSTEMFPPLLSTKL